MNSTYRAVCHEDRRRAGWAEAGIIEIHTILPLHSVTELSVTATALRHSCAICLVEISPLIPALRPLAVHQVAFLANHLPLVTVAPLAIDQPCFLFLRPT